MSRKRLTPEQIIMMLREAEVLLRQGAPVWDAWRKLGVSERRACQVLGQPRSTQRHLRNVPTDEDRLIEPVVSLASRCRRIAALLRNEGWRQEYNRFKPYSSLGDKPPAPETEWFENPNQGGSTLIGGESELGRNKTGIFHSGCDILKTRKRTMRKILPLFLLPLVFVACGRYAWFPPEVTFPPEQKIGLIQFTAKNAEGGLDVFATEQFLREVIQAQRGIRLLELGTLQAVLADAGAEKLDANAVRKIGSRHGVDSIFTGEIKISDVRPQVSLDAFVKNFGVRASFTISVSAKLQATDSGAVLWTDSVERKETVAYFGLIQGEIPYFGVQDKDEANRRLISEVMYDLTWDFRPSKRRI